MFRKFFKSPWTGAVGAVTSWLWEAFWLIGPPVGIGQAERNAYLFWGLVAVLISGGQAFFVLIRENKQLKETLNAAPKLVARGFSDLHTQTLADFYHLRIANLPMGTQRRETAEKVVGTVTIFDERGTQLAPPRVHRWASSPFYPGLPGKSDLELPINIDANGMEHSFDVAHKWEAETDFFTHNNESVAKYGYKDPNYKFGPGTYLATIEMRGKNTSVDFRCQIVNHGRNSKLTIGLL